MSCKGEHGSMTRAISKSGPSSAGADAGCQGLATSRADAGGWGLAVSAGPSAS